MPVPRLDLHADPVELTAALVDIPSVSHDEAVIADAVETALREQTSGFEIVRCGNAVLARTNRGLGSRVMLAGHLDTVPIADNVPSRRDGDLLWGCGTVDMKSGDAVFLHLAATVADLAHDLTLVFYDCEEIAAQYNGLGRIERARADERDARLGGPADVDVHRVAERGPLPDELPVRTFEIDQIPVQAGIEARGEPRGHVGGEHGAGEEDGVEAFVLHERRERVHPGLGKRSVQLGIVEHVHRLRPV